MDIVEVINCDGLVVVVVVVAVVAVAVVVEVVVIIIVLVVVVLIIVVVVAVVIVVVVIVVPIIIVIVIVVVVVFANFVMFASILSSQYYFVLSPQVDLKDKNPDLIDKTYTQMYKDVRAAVDMCHKDGSIKDKVMQAPADYILYDDALVRLLLQLRQAGKKVVCHHY